MNILIKILSLIPLFGLSTCCDVICERHKYAEMLIKKVERFENQNERLPKDVSERGLEVNLESPAFYELTSDTTYLVWYGLSVGESKVYRSLTKTWTEEG